MSVVRPPDTTEQLAGVLGELLAWLRCRNPRPAAPDSVEAMHTRYLMLDPPEAPEVTRAKLNATLAKFRLTAGRKQLKELQAVGLTLRIEDGRLMVSPATLVTEDLRKKIERGREYLLLALTQE